MLILLWNNMRTTGIPTLTPHSLPPIAHTNVQLTHIRDCEIKSRDLYCMKTEKRANENMHWKWCTHFRNIHLTPATVCCMLYAREHWTRAEAHAKAPGSGTLRWNYSKLRETNNKQWRVKCIRKNEWHRRKSGVPQSQRIQWKMRTVEQQRKKQIQANVFTTRKTSKIKIRRRRRRRRRIVDTPCYGKLKERFPEQSVNVSVCACNVECTSL